MSNWNILYSATSTSANITVEEEIFSVWCLPQAQVLGTFSKNESAISQNLVKEKKIFCSYLNSKTKSNHAIFYEYFSVTMDEAGM